jgi:hypothetical protein
MARHEIPRDRRRTFRFSATEFTRRRRALESVLAAAGLRHALLYGANRSGDCVDRIVLNAYYPLGYNPGGFRVWWRRWHEDSDEQLDNAHLMRLAGRFARRVRALGRGAPGACDRLHGRGAQAPDR